MYVHIQSISLELFSCNYQKLLHCIVPLNSQLSYQLKFDRNSQVALDTVFFHEEVSDLTPIPTSFYKSSSESPNLLSRIRDHRCNT